MKRASLTVGVGLPTLITVLLVLLLAIFSALALTATRADLALSRINAETVAAYYGADGAATRLYADFVAGDEAELEATLPMTETQSLRLHLVREDGVVRVLAWQTVAAETEGDFEEESLPLWDGTNPN